MPTYWTITDSNNVEKTFEEWGLKGGSNARRSLHVGTLTVTAEGQDIDSDNLFAYRSQVIVQRNRVKQSDGSFTAGSIYFKGYTTGIRRVGNAEDENIQYVFSDVWWLFTRIVYAQTWPAFTTTHVIMNMIPDYTGTMLGVRSQIAAVLDYVLTLFPGAFTYDVSNIPTLFPPTDEKRDVTCDDALKSQARWIPGLTTYIDHAQSPPKVYFSTRYGQTGAFGSGPLTVVMPTVLLTIGDNVTVTSSDIVPLYDFQVSQAIIRYEQSNTVDGQTVIVPFIDKYPPSTTDNLNIFQATVNLQGAKVSDQVATISTRNISAIGVGTSGQTATWTWWIEKHPWLSTAVNLNIHDIIYTDSASNIVTPLSFELLNDGTLHNWMRDNSGNLKQQVEVTVKALADYTDENGNIRQNEPLTVRLKTTNLASGTYRRQKVSQYAEPVPSGMAFAFYTLLNVLQYEGVVTVTAADGEVPTTQFLGSLLNLNGGASDWSTMQALIHGVDEDLETGVVTVQFGRNQFLSPSALIDLLRVTRSRNYTDYTQSFSVNQGQIFDVQSPDNTAKQDSTKGNAKVNKNVISFTDPTTQKQATLTLDAINKILTMSTDDPTDPVVQISLADITAP